MKTSLLLIMMMACAFATQAQKSKTKTTGTSDIEAVKAVIEKETKAFFEINYAAWEQTWAKVPYAYWSFADTTDVNYFEGWNNIRDGFAGYFQTAKPSQAHIERVWHDIKVTGNMAYARFTQRILDNVKRDNQAEVRVLEKVNGQWKIVHVGVIAQQKKEPITTASN